MQVKPFPQLFQSLPVIFDDPLIRFVQWACENDWIDTNRWYLSYETENHTWLSFRRKSVDLVAQGWKLHVSADLTSVETILQRILPFLLHEAAAFKFASSLEHLQKLNSGLMGESQIGKFLTVYPGNDDEAVRLAIALDERTRGLSGPRIPSDRMLRPDSLVFYRYGGFTGQAYVQELLGQVWPAIRTPDNYLIRDSRGLKYLAPEQRIDPFIASGAAVQPADLPKSQRILAQRYLVVSVISSTPNHTVSLAIDLECQRTCIIKGQGRLWQNTLPATEREHALQEANALRELHGCERIPVLYDLLEQENDISLILSDIPGQHLTERLNKEQVYSLPLFPQIITWGRDLAEILQSVHQKGFVFADIKPTNIIIGPDEKLYLIDFELAARQGTLDKEKRGTRGYMSPQQSAGLPRSITDDMYSFGALLYLLVTSTEPSQAPDSFALLKRPVESLRPDVPPALTEIITCCLQELPEARYASMAEVIAALEALEKDGYEPLSCSISSSFTTTAEERSQARETASKILTTLCRKARKVEAGGRADGLTWKTTHPIANNYALRDINVGLSGTILALAGLTAELAEPEAEARSILAQSAHYLRTLPPHSDPPLPGLYVGEAGVGAALLLAGQILGDQALINAAIECGKLVAALPQLSPDIMHGTAGRLLFQLLLWDETGSQEHLTAARACGEHLLETAQRREPGEICWTVPAEFKVFSSHAYAGYAHGVAGIADALLDLFEVTGDERFLPHIQGAAQWLQRLAIPVLADRSALGWPATEDRHIPSPPLWCHGASGIGRFFLHASRHAWLPGAMDTAVRAAQSVIHLGKAGGPTLCHGLAGNLEFLLDMYQETRQPFYLAQAHAFGKLLEAFATEQEGHLVFHADQKDIFSPDYMVGYAGIALTFLRLSDPEHIPYQLSRAGFQTYKRRAERRT